jgi:hypothetical protein
LKKRYYIEKEEFELIKESLSRAKSFDNIHSLEYFIN